MRLIFSVFLFSAMFLNAYPSTLYISYREDPPLNSQLSRINAYLCLYHIPTISQIVLTDDPISEGAADIVYFSRTAGTSTTVSVDSYRLGLHVPGVQGKLFAGGNPMLGSEWARMIAQIRYGQAINASQRCLSATGTSSMTPCLDTRNCTAGQYCDAYINGLSQTQRDSCILGSNAAISPTIHDRSSYSYPLYIVVDYPKGRGTSLDSTLSTLLRESVHLSEHFGFARSKIKLVIVSSGVTIHPDTSRFNGRERCRDCYGSSYGCEHTNPPASIIENYGAGGYLIDMYNQQWVDGGYCCLSRELGINWNDPATYQSMVSLAAQTNCGLTDSSSVLNAIIANANTMAKVLFLSDGSGIRNTHTTSNLQELAERQIMVTTISIPPNSGTFVNEIAEATGGSVFKLNAPHNAARAVFLALAGLSNHIVIIDSRFEQSDLIPGYTPFYVEWPNPALSKVVAVLACNTGVSCAPSGSVTHPNGNSIATLAPGSPSYLPSSPDHSSYSANHFSTSVRGRWGINHPQSGGDILVAASRVDDACSFDTFVRNDGIRIVTVQCPQNNPPDVVKVTLNDGTTVDMGLNPSNGNHIGTCGSGWHVSRLTLVQVNRTKNTPQSRESMPSYPRIRMAPTTSTGCSILHDKNLRQQCVPIRPAAFAASLLEHPLVALTGVFLGMLSLL